MEFLGEFLSPNNSIAQDQDKLTKYFYFRPDKYDDPDADLENIFIIKGMEEFPKRLDKLAENEDYAIESIEVSKRIADDQIGVTDVSYVVTATYDLLENIQKREQTSTTETESSSGKVDENGNSVTAQTKPWQLRAKWNFQPIEVVVPFRKAYGVDGVYVNAPVVDVVNSAHCMLLAETKRYQLEITYQKSYREPQLWEGITSPYTNEDDFDLNFDYRGSFPAGTLLILPPTFSTEWYQEEENGEKVWTRYYSYSVRMIYDPQGHDKELLDVGTYALFPGSNRPSQIWEVTVVDENGVVENGYPMYTSASNALIIQAQSLNSGKTVSASPVTEPLPLIGGYVYTGAIEDPTTYRYDTLEYIQYARFPFAQLPFKN